MNTRSIQLRALAVASLLALCGCSFSHSSESISNSVSGSFNSSSSSSGGDSESGYRDDVRDYTATFVKANGDPASFDRGIATLAKRHYVTNWEADASTWVGMGEGLAKADLSPGEVEHYKQQLAGGDEQRMRAIQQGYDKAKAK